MNHTRRVGRMNGAAQRLDGLRRVLRALRFAIEFVVEVATIDEFEREVRGTVVFADIVNLHDVRVVQLRDGFGFRTKPFEVRFADIRAADNHLQRDDAVEVNVPRFVNDPHAAFAEFVEDLVRPNEALRRDAIPRRRDDRLCEYGRRI